MEQARELVVENPWLALAVTNILTAFLVTLV